MAEECETCGSCGTGGWTGPKPGDPDNNAVLTATPAFGGIDVQWTYPGLNPHAVAHTILFRGLSADFNGAIQHKIVAGNFFHDATNDNIRYYYWIQFISINGTPGELIGPASAVARPRIEDIIEDITDRIDRGVLAQALKAELDQISIINANLLNEITARENSEITLAQALEDAQNGVAEALSFITSVQNSLTDSTSALAEAIDLVAVTIDGEYAAVIQSMQTSINTLTGDVYAMYTAKVDVNGLIGGFGIANDGHTVEAGFDVDRFWVGRTNDDKRKPFIIENDEVFIDEAAINKLTFSKLRNEQGNFVVGLDGKLQAAYISAYGLAIQNSIGAVTFQIDSTGNAHFRGGGALMGGGFTSYNWHPSGYGGFYLGPEGLLLGNFYTGQFVQIDQSGNFYAPGMSIVSGHLTINELSVINTANIAGNAVTVPVSSYAASELQLPQDENWHEVQGIDFLTGGGRVYMAFSSRIEPSIWTDNLGEGGTIVEEGRVEVAITGISTEFVTSLSGCFSFSEAVPNSLIINYRVYARNLPPLRTATGTRTLTSGGKLASRSFFIMETKR